MKIGSLDTFTAQDVASSRGTVRAAGTQAPVGIPATDQATVSAAAAQLGSSGSDFDSAKVDAIRQAIREGRFKVNPDAIADRLLADAAALLGPRAS